MSMKNSNDTSWDRTTDLPICSAATAVPQKRMVRDKGMERNHWGDLGVDGWILGWISRRWDVGIRTGLGWPRIETVGGRL